MNTQRKKTSRVPSIVSSEKNKKINNLLKKESKMLDKIPIFSELNEQALAKFSALLVRREFPKNKMIISQGDKSRSLFLIEKGRVKVFTNSEEGKQTTLAFLTEGEFCGELSLLDAEPRSASVITLEKTVVLQLTYSQFDGLLKKYPEVCYPMFKALTSRIREIDLTICGLTSLDVYGRLVQLLNKEAKNEKGIMITPRLTQLDIAETVGSSREMISRILSELRKGGYVQIDKKRIIINKKLPKNW